jgi:riboflavin kinase
VREVLSNEKSRETDDSLKPTLWYSLLKLSELGALNRKILVSTIALAGDRGVSQQTASKHLIELDGGGYIERQASAQGNHIKITEKGRRAVEEMYLKLRSVIDKKPQMLTFKGKVVNGLGEGAYYMSRPGYREQFSRKLGFNPFPGTLNLRLVPSQEGVKRELETLPAITIKGFKRGKRTFGEVKCFPAVINDSVKGAVALINRTHHDDLVIELIAPTHLRRSLGLREGSDVKVTIVFNS